MSCQKVIGSPSLTSSCLVNVRDPLPFILPSSIMEHSSTSIVLVNHDFKALTQRFPVRTTPNDLIVHLKAKVKECFHGSDDIPELNSTSLAMLVVWKTMGTKIINLFSEECLPEILSTIDVNDKNTVQKLSEEVKLVDLGLSNFQSLLVQLPGTSHIFISQAVSSYGSSWR